jgi:hypothetical protein
MRVMCIEQVIEPGIFTIEPGEWLEVYDGSKDYFYYTFERNGNEWFTEKSKYITIQQWRDKQLNKLF